MKKKYLFIIIFLLLPLVSFAQILDLNKFSLISGINDDRIGSALVAGDLNNDGIDDLVIGSPSSELNGFDSGAAYIFYGKKAAFNNQDINSADVIIVGNYGTYFGSKVISNMDINNDGFSDLLIVASSTKNNNVDTATAYFFYGKAERLTGTINVSQADAQFITNERILSISAGGDVNNDNYDDILFGLSSYNIDLNSFFGPVDLVYGQKKLFTGTIDLSDADAQFNQDLDRWDAGLYPSSVAIVNDMNGDGYDEIAIGDYNVDTQDKLNAGAVYLYYGQQQKYSGNININKADVKFIGGQDLAELGEHVASGGDVNQDGYSELLIEQKNVNAENQSEMYLIYGQNKKLDKEITMTENDPHFQIKSSNFDNYQNAISAGDLNKDGYNDLVFSVQNSQDWYDRGFVYIVNGKQEKFQSHNFATSAPLHIEGNMHYLFFGDALVTADLNGDKFPELLLGAHGYDIGLFNYYIPGAIYLGYLYQDNDGDGMAGNQGILSGIDSDDSQNNAYIEQVSGEKNGAIKLNYSNNSFKNLTIFSDQQTEESTSVQQYLISPSFLALDSDGQQLALVDINQEQIKDVIKLSKSQKYTDNNLQLATIRNHDFAVILSKKINNNIISLVRIKDNALSLVRQKKFNNSQVSIDNTVIKNHKIRIKNKKNITISEYYINYKYQLIKKINK